MTPTQIELHNAHKARLQRIAQAAARLNPKTDKEYSAALNAEENKDEWADRQIRYHKPFWFSVTSACKITKKGLPTIRSIQRTTCDVFDVNLHDILSSRRTLPLIIPRQVSMYLAKEMTLLSYPRIARATGDRDHTTAMHAHRKIAKLLQSDGMLAARVAEIRERLS